MRIDQLALGAAKGSPDATIVPITDGREFDAELSRATDPHRPGASHAGETAPGHRGARRTDPARDSLVAGPGRDRIESPRDPRALAVEQQVDVDSESTAVPASTPAELGSVATAADLPTAPVADPATAAAAPVAADPTAALVAGAVTAAPAALPVTTPVTTPAPAPSTAVGPAAAAPSTAHAVATGNDSDTDTGTASNGTGSGVPLADADPSAAGRSPGQAGSATAPVATTVPVSAHATTDTAAPVDPAAAALTALGLDVRVESAEADRPTTPVADAAVPADTTPAPVVTAAPVTVAPIATAAPSVVSTPSGPVVTNPVAEQIVPHVQFLRRAADGTHHATLVLNPEHLGPVRIRMELADGSVNLHLSGLHVAAADALREALPDLRRSLADSGLTVGTTEVTEHEFDAASSAWGGQSSGSPETGPRTANAPRIDATASPTVPDVVLPARSVRAGGVDVLA